jgi:hypothetical protein
MTPTTPHLKRCKNGCRNLECEYCPDTNDHEKRGKPLREKLLIWAFTTKHGCNSFSIHDFPSESPSSSDVLEDFEIWLSNQCTCYCQGDENDLHIGLDKISDWIDEKRKELRTKEREQG